MYKTALLGIAILVGACSSDGDSGDGDGGGDTPIECSAADRTGTYLMRYETLSGTCGDIPESIGRLENAAQELAEGCVFNADDRWTDDDCKLERAITCPFPEACAGCTLRGVAVTTQQTEDGSLITGTTTVTALDSDGTLGCTGTYRIRGERQ